MSTDKLEEFTPEKDTLKNIGILSEQTLEVDPDKPKSVGEIMQTLNEKIEKLCEKIRKIKASRKVEIEYGKVIGILPEEKDLKKNERALLLLQEDRVFNSVRLNLSSKSQDEGASLTEQTTKETIQKMSLEKMREIILRIYLGLESLEEKPKEYYSGRRRITKKGPSKKEDQNHNTSIFKDIRLVNRFSLGIRPESCTKEELQEVVKYLIEEVLI